MKKSILSGRLLAGLVLTLSGAMSASATQIWVKGEQVSKPLTVFNELGQKVEKAPAIPVDQIKAMGRIPVLAERGAYIQIQLADGQKVWILSEKVQLERPASCGQGSPGDVISVVKKETNAARGVGEACGGKK